MSGVGGSRFENKNGQAYGYTSQQTLNSNYGGVAPQSTNYGYSGANAYRPSTGGLSTGSKIALAAGAGVLVGAGSMYLFSRWNSNCMYGSDWTGSCQECYRAYSTYDQCRVLDPPHSLNRDDLMGTGFWPADFTSPLRVAIFGIEGADFTPSSVCPPPGWNVNWTNVTAGSFDIYLTLTQISELGERLAEEESGLSTAEVVASLASLVCCCGCIVALGAMFVKMRQGTGVQQWGLTQAQPEPHGGLAHPPQQGGFSPGAFNPGGFNPGSFGQPFSGLSYVQPYTGQNPVVMGHPAGPQK